MKKLNTVAMGIMVGGLLLGALSAARAETPSLNQRQCVAEAYLTLFHSHAYRNADVRLKQQMKNAFAAKISKVRAACRQK